MALFLPLNTLQIQRTISSQCFLDISLDDREVDFTPSFVQHLLGFWSFNLLLFDLLHLSHSYWLNGTWTVAVAFSQSEMSYLRVDTCTYLV